MAWATHDPGAGFRNLEPDSGRHKPPALRKEKNSPSIFGSKGINQHEVGATGTRLNPSPRWSNVTWMRSGRQCRRICFNWPKSLANWLDRDCTRDRGQTPTLSIVGRAPGRAQMYGTGTNHVLRPVPRSTEAAGCALCPRHCPRGSSRSDPVLSLPLSIGVEVCRYEQFASTRG